MTNKKLPPLNMLKAFVTSAHHLSFSEAAKEMNLTQGAISKQIKVLEEYFGQPLFKRVNRGLELTKNAEEYYANISMALDSISSASEKMFKDNDVRKNNILIVHAFASFTNCFLLPKIQDFKNKNPDIDIYITSGYGSEVDLKEFDCDVAIWGYKHSFKNIENEKLFDEKMVLVCAKSLIKSKIKSVDDLKNYPFLINNYRPEVLISWAKSVKIGNNIIKNALRFDYLYMIIEGVKQGLGLAFIPEFLVKDLLKNKTLINPLKIKYRTKFSFYEVYPKGKTEKVKRFSKWLKDQIVK